MELLDGATLREQLHDGAVGPRKAIGTRGRLQPGSARPTRNALPIAISSRRTSS